MIDRKKIVIGFVALFLVSACTNSSETGTGGEVVIQVDNRVLTLTEFNQFFEPLRMSYPNGQGAAAKVVREARLRFLLQLLEEMIILRRADELDLYVSDQEIEQAVGNVKKDYDQESFETVFMKQTVSLETWKERLKRQILVEKVIRRELVEQISITPEEIRDYYDKHRGKWTHGEETRVSHILLPSEELANHVLEELNKGGDFATLARLHSVAPESEAGGDMGYVARGDLPKSLEDPVFTLQEGIVSPVIKTPYGYHIFKVTGKKEACEPVIDELIEKIKGCIQEEKLEAAYGPWLANLRSRYRITVNKEMI